MNKQKYWLDLTILYEVERMVKETGECRRNK